VEGIETQKANFSIVAFTRRGSGRDQNEDACGIGGILLFGKDTNSGQKLVKLSQLPFLVTLADGLGGHSSGDIASRTAIKHLNDIFKSSRGEFKIDEAISDVHHHIRELEEGSSGPYAMGTTIVGAVINEELCTIFNVGDSRAYWVHDAGINQVSEDDVYPGERTGILTQCLGGGNPVAPKPHFIQQDIRSGDILVLVSDGITDAIPDDVIKSVVSERSPECSFNLCEEANRLGGSDDASAIICKFS